MKELKKNNLYLKVLKFWESHPGWFTYEKLKLWVKLEEWETNIILRYLYNAVLNNEPRNQTLHETIFLEIRIDPIPEGMSLKWISTPTILNESEKQKIETAIQDTVFTLKYDAYFNYIDYLELQKAIENSKQASSHAKIAIWIATILGFIQILIWIIQINSK